MNPTRLGLAPEGLPRNLRKSVFSAGFTDSVQHMGRDPGHLQDVVRRLQSWTPVGRLLIRPIQSESLDGILDFP